MSISKKVQLTDSTVDLCNLFTLGSEPTSQWSDSFARIVSFCEIILKDNAPSLSDNQTEIFRIIYNNDYKVKRRCETVEDEIERFHLHLILGFEKNPKIKKLLISEFKNKDGIDAFINEAKDWTKTKKLAVIYMARKFWRSKNV